jgi:hypothetical protein
MCIRNTIGCKEVTLRPLFEFEVFEVLLEAPEWQTGKGLGFDEHKLELCAPLSPKRRALCCSSTLSLVLPLFSPYCWRTMSCCGSPRPEDTDKSVPAVGTRSVPIGGGAFQQQQQFPVSQQPTGHPGIISPFPPPSSDASSFRPPDFTPPSTVYPMAAHLNGTTHTPPPPPTMTTSTLHGSVPSSPPSTVPQMGMYTSASPPVVDPNGPLSPLRRPSPTYPTSGSSNPPNLLSTYQSPANIPSLPPIDEGKMSVSIDFGERRPLLNPNPTPRSKLTVMVQELPSLAW